MFDTVFCSALGSNTMPASLAETHWNESRTVEAVEPHNW